MGCTNVTSVNNPIRLDLAKDNIRNSITLEKALSFNSTSCLLKGRDRTNSKPVYLRFIRLKSQYTRSLEQKMIKLSTFNPPLSHLVPYLHKGENLQYYYLVMDCMEREGLFEAIMKNHFEVTEFSLCFGLRGIFETLGLMHSKGICHGLISPKRILVSEDVCWIVDPSTGLETVDDIITENQYYSAPEVINGELPGIASDVWSIGAIIYHLISGHTVYETAPLSEYIKLMISSEPIFIDPVWTHVSSELIQLLKQMLNKNPDKRITIKEILESEWLNTIGFSRTENLMRHNGLLLSNIRLSETIEEIINIFANEMSEQKLDYLMRELESLDYVKSGKVTVRFLLEKVLDPDNNFIKEIRYDNTQVEYKDIIKKTMMLNKLIVQERISVVFYKLSNGRRFVGKSAIQNIMMKCGLSILMDNENDFKDKVKRMQSDSRNEVNLTCEEFSKIFIDYDYNISEEFIYM